MALSFCGCTSPLEYIRNGFKVGPNYRRPPAPVERDWIDASDKRVRSESGDLSQWWKVFNDPVLNKLICTAYNQNLTLRQAGFRILEARAQLRIAVGGLFPQTQSMMGAYTREAISRETANRGVNPTTGVSTIRQFFPQWDYGFTLAWELDFWGRFRRAIEAAADSLNASVADYDDALVTLLSDVATAYVNIRTTEKRIAYAKKNAALQRVTYDIAVAKKGTFATDLDVDQALSTVKQTEATIPELEIMRRQFANQLCILLGIPPEDLLSQLGSADIPTAPPEVVIGIPADLLRRRPDIRRAERQAAAQCAQIGVAESALYPHISLRGVLDYQAEKFKNLFNSKAISGSFAPGFQWDILNYGRLINGVRFQEARFQELVAAYQQTVLTGYQETENGLVSFLKAQERKRLQLESVVAERSAVKTVNDQWTGGFLTDYTRVTQLQLNLVVLEDTLAQAEGEIALGLIQVYKGLGGGWEMRCNGCDPSGPGQPAKLPAPEDVLPAPRPVSPSPKPEPGSKLPDPESVANDQRPVRIPIKVR